MGTHKKFGEDDEETIVEKPVPTFLSKTSASKQRRHISKPNRNDRQQRSGKQPSSHGKSIRGQLRSIERLLKNKGSQLPPGVRKAKEEQLKELIRLRDEHGRREAERKTLTKYKMVKFFERRKLQRVLDKIIEHGDKPEDGDRKKQILRDLQYIDEYPKDKKYIALFPSGGHTEESRKRVEAMRKEIEGKSGINGAESPSRTGDDNPGGTETNVGDDFFLNDDSD